MSIAFKLAPTVASGDPITASHLVDLADAFNDRLRANIGDCTWRIHYYIYNLFRQVRNSDGAFLFPTSAEFFEVYQNLTGTHWPAGLPGEPEGVNVANPLMAFIFGSASLGIDSEALRLASVPVEYNGAAPATDEQFWELAKLQRGAYDPITQGVGSPSFEAARTFAGIRSSSLSMHGQSWGGYMATPPLAPDACLSDDPDPPANRQYSFTAKVDDANYLIISPDGTTTLGSGDKTFDGSCPPCSSDDYDSHVYGVSWGSWAYYVSTNDGTLYVFRRAEYIEGPYTGEPRLRKTSGNHLIRVLNAFIQDFRGSTSQRETINYHLGHAFDFQRFFTTQYHLAPALGTEINGSVVPDYPKASWTGAASHPTGISATWSTGGNSRPWASNSVCTGCLIQQTGLVGSVSIAIRDGSTLISTISISAGDAPKMVLFDALQPASMQCALTSPAEFNSDAGSLEIEFTELYNYKPELWDAYLVLRLGAANWSSSLDGSGTLTDNADVISDNYFAHGCITNVNAANGLPGHTNEVDNDAIYDAARRLSKFVRIMPRAQIQYYAVENGKSICWFKRYALGTGISNPIDLFDGIAPATAAIPSGSLRPGVTYLVKTGSVNYNDNTYSDGDTFTAEWNVRDYDGGGECWEYNGILSDAPEQNLSNEWLMGVQFKAYHESESSIWKASAYSDQYPFINRCHLFSPEIAMDPSWLYQTSYGQRSASPAGVYIAESPSGYNYAPLEIDPMHFGGSINNVSCGGDPTCEAWRINFFKSCQIYAPDPEIESVVMDTIDSQELVKVTFKSRLQYCATADATIDQDFTTWDTGALAAQPYRTLENGIQEYIIYQNLGLHCTAGGIRTGQAGNNDANGDIQSLTDNPRGTCYPHFLFTKLIPKPYEDGQADWSTKKTHITSEPFVQMELYLRAICEGFIDGQTTTENACSISTTRLYSFTYENLCYQAFGGSSIGFMPSTATDNIETDDTRPDKPWGSGPIPNTLFSSEIYNQFSSAINLLTLAPVYLPLKWQCAQDSISATKWIPAVNADGTSANCTSGYCAVYAQNNPPDPGNPTFTTPTWNDNTCLGTPSSYCQVTFGPTCSGGLWELTTNRTSAKFQWAPPDANMLEAIPVEWRDQIATDAALLAKVSQASTRIIMTVTDYANSAGCITEGGSPGAWYTGRVGEYLRFDGEDLIDPLVETCEILGTEYHAPTPEPSVYAFARTVEPAECQVVNTTSITVTPIATAWPLIRIPYR